MRIRGTQRYDHYFTSHDYNLSVVDCQINIIHASLLSLSHPSYKIMPGKRQMWLIHIQYMNSDLLDWWLIQQSQL